MCCDVIDLETKHYDPNDITIGVGKNCKPLTDLESGLGRAFIDLFTSPRPSSAGGAAEGAGILEMIVP